ETYGTAHTRALTVASRDFFLHPPAGFTEHPILAPRGVLYIAQAGQEEQLETAYQAYQAQGLEVHRLTAAQAIEMVPCLLPDTLIGAIHDPIASDMDVHALHQGFLQSMRSKGAVLKPNAMLESASREGDTWSLHTASGDTWRAHVIVNAAGAWA